MEVSTTMTISLRGATDADLGVLAYSNREFIEDEGYRNPPSSAELVGGMREWLHNNVRSRAGGM